MNDKPHMGDLLEDVRRLERRVDALERAVATIGGILHRQGPSDAITQILEGLGLWNKPQRGNRTRGRR